MLIAFVAAMSFATRPAAASEVYVWEAVAEEYGGMMQATYVEEIYEDDTASQVLEVVVTDGPRRARIGITIEGVEMGMLVTDDTGFGYFSKLRFDLPLNDEGRPAAPRIRTGDMIQLEYWDLFVEAPFEPLF